MDDEDNYCYHCGYEHPMPSLGMYPAEGCDDYEPTETGEIK
jgi:hypothetical protein